jgi:hypothetical protein
MFLDYPIAIDIAIDLVSTYFLFVACVVAVGAAATTTFESAVISPLTSKLSSVPTEVKLEVSTVAFNSVPVSVPASAVTVMFAVPSNAVPLIVLAVVKRVAVPEFPVTLPVTLPVNAPVNVFAETVAAEIAVNEGELTGTIAHVEPFHIHVSDPLVNV